MTATDVAPDAITEAAVSSVMPPIATTGKPDRAARSAAARTASSPMAPESVRFVVVPNTGPIAA